MVMIDKIHLIQRWEIYALFIGVMGLCAFLTWMVFYSEEPAEPLQTPPLNFYYYTPPLSLEERILEANMIARVRLHSVSSSAEPLDPDEEGVQSNEYIGALVYTFQVLESLKGSGGSQIVGIVHTGYSSQGYASQQEAVLQGDALLKGRNTQWDDREAIVFLRDDWILASTQQPDRYFFGTQSYLGDGYTIASEFSKRWLPAASSGEVSGASGSDGQRFLTDEPSIGSSGGASGSSEQAPSMTLAELKTRIGAMEALINAGDGSDEYRECLIAKYEWERDIQHYNYVDQRYDYDFESGLPAGRWVYEDWRTLNTREHFSANPQAPRPEYWLEGRDKELFYVEHPGVVFAKRPLPEGEYKMHYQVRGHKFIVCDAYPESERTRDEYVVHVTAPASTLHEAFFDPVAIGSAVGADGSNGVLKPASFTVEGAGAVSIERLAWADGQVRMQLSPSMSLPDHHIDFIAPDGAVSMRLDFDDAAAVDDGGTRALSWGVCEQPWANGDLLMLRISASGSDLLRGATNNADCAASPPTPTPTHTATPTPTPAVETAYFYPTSDAHIQPLIVLAGKASGCGGPGIWDCLDETEPDNEQSMVYLYSGSVLRTGFTVGSDDIPGAVMDVRFEVDMSAQSGTLQAGEYGYAVYSGDSVAAELSGQEEIGEDWRRITISDASILAGLTDGLSEVAFQVNGPSSSGQALKLTRVRMVVDYTASEGGE